MGWMPKPPDPNPGLLASAQASERIATEQLNLAREQFAWARQQDEVNWRRMQPIFEQQMRIADAQEARAAEYFNREKTVNWKVQDAFIKKAMEYNSDVKKEELAGEAASDVEQQMGIARESANRSLARFGINPNSGKFGAINAELTQATGLARAGAKNNARAQAEIMGNAMLQDASAMTQGLAGNATAAATLSSNAGLGAGNLANQTFQTGSAARLGAINTFNNAQQGYQTAGGLYGQDFNARMQGYNAKMSAYGQIMNGIGQIGGMWASGGMSATKKPFGVGADGGPVEAIPAPGTPPNSGPTATDPRARGDDVPVMLSRDEFVVPAPVVRQLGIRYFENLIQKHGSPENVNASAARSGIKRPSPTIGVRG